MSRVRVFGEIVSDSMDGLRVLSSVAWVVVGLELWFRILPHTYVAQLFAYFRLFFMLLMGIGGILWAILDPESGHQWSFWGLGAYYFLCFWQYIGTYIRSFFRKATPCDLKIYQCNVQYNNRDVETIIARVAQEDPDVLFFVEANEYWKTHLINYLTEQGYYYVETPPDGEHDAGRIIFSRYPLDEESVSVHKQSNSFLLQVRTVVKGVPITLLNLHPEACITYRKYQLQVSDWHGIQNALRESDTPLIACGDLNVTPWHTQLKRTLQEFNLKDGQSHCGLRASFPAWPLLFPIIPLDHCFVSHHFKFRKQYLGKHVGSDHYPVVTTVDLVDGFPSPHQGTPANESASESKESVKG